MNNEAFIIACNTTNIFSLKYYCELTNVSLIIEDGKVKGVIKDGKKED